MKQLSNIKCVCVCVYVTKRVFLLLFKLVRAEMCYKRLLICVVTGTINSESYNHNKYCMNGSSCSLSDNSDE